MIISKTPLRISLVGGGTDFEAYYKKRPGEVISFAIDKSIYVAINKRFDGRLHLRYSKTEVGDTPDDLKHDIVRECLKTMEIKGGVEIVITSDVPSVGTGLGSSSALTVGLLNALGTYVGANLENECLAEMACQIEIEKVKSPIGKQDQYACALGNFNYIRFDENGSVYCVCLYRSYKEIIDQLLGYLVLFYIPQSRDSSEILEKFSHSINDNRIILDNNIGLVGKFLSYLRSGIFTAEELGGILNTSWQIKRDCSSASNEIVELAFTVAEAGGFLGGKICGAGGGGFMILVDDNKGDKLVRTMEESGFKHTSFRLNEQGTHIIYRG